MTLTRSGFGSLVPRGLGHLHAGTQDAETSPERTPRQIRRRQRLAQSVMSVEGSGWYDEGGMASLFLFPIAPGRKGALGPGDASRGCFEYVCAFQREVQGEI